MNRHGMTLLEVMVSVAILTSVMGVLFVLAEGMGSASRQQEAKMTAMDEARRGMQFMIRELRQSARRSIAWATLPTNTLSYRLAIDADGNGLAVDINGDLELSSVRTIGPDTTDINTDGLTTTQLILTDGNMSRVLANDLVPGTGIQFEQWANGLRIILRTQKRAGIREQLMPCEMSEIVIPRN